MAVAYTIRRAEAGDIPAFLDLVDALADFETLPRPAAEARERLAADALAGRYHLLVAEVGGRVQGYAVFFYTYSTFLARPTLYLEDYFVAPDCRGIGAGGALFRAVAAEAVKHACGRMEWQVLDWNTPSIELYERLGARRMSEWLPMRLDGQALANVGARGLAEAEERARA